MSKLAQEKEWATQSTGEILELLFELNELKVPIKGKNVLLALKCRLDDSPSDATVYRTLNALVERGLVDKNSQQYRINEEGVEFVLSCDEIVESVDPRLGPGTNSDENECRKISS